MPDGGTKTTIDSAMVGRATGQTPNYGVVDSRYVIAGTTTAWMSPGPGLPPLTEFPGAQTRGRQFDFPVNVKLKPRNSSSRRSTRRRRSWATFRASHTPRATRLRRCGTPR
ncbi:hypothetical protein [Burkholderia sp. JKS000303]|uniref:hypothetical protein n=1 Tax=Burkholderia sp. JKS000303 TaxID=1938747 RepID=UPI000C00D639|nr:hypothetical protein [Burkholderia sp. JKS000303]PFH26315.1 hypothetical protein BX604_0006 [Burkholderia sp. JKS000303]